MLIIKEVEYAIMIIDELHRRSPLSAGEIARRKQIPSPFIYRVLKKLAERGILSIKRGKKGGYDLAVDCRDLSIHDVISAFDNTFYVVECIKEGHVCDNRDKDCCRLHKGFLEIQAILVEEFRRKTLSELLGTDG